MLSFKRVLSLFVLLALAACSQQASKPHPVYYDQAHGGRVFQVAYDHFDALYIEDLDLGELTMTGLENLAFLDTRIAVRARDGMIEILGDEEQLVALERPRSNHPGRWAKVTSEAISTMQMASSVIAANTAEEIYEAFFDSTLEELDDYTRYAGRADAREHRASREGFGGIGVRINVVEEGVLIIDVMEATPAERAGLKADDLIVAVDGQSLIGLDQREAVGHLRGPRASSALLTVERTGSAHPLPIIVTRDHIVPQTVRYRLEEDVVYLEILSFNQSTASTLRRKMILGKQALGPKLRGYVLDLRNNPGGLLDQAVEVADLFTPRGRIVSTHGRHPDSHQYFDGDEPPFSGDRPIVVLVNGLSASAAEIVAAALQDTGRAVVVGSNTFGKGTVQQVVPLPNEGELTITWARFHAPSSYTLNRRGVLPDVCVVGVDPAEENFASRLRRGEFLISWRTQHQSVDPLDEDALAALRAECPTDESRLEQSLEVAKVLLQDPSLFATARGLAPTAEAFPPAKSSGLSLRQ